jgi:hypothetical protein
MPEKMKGLGDRVSEMRGKDKVSKHQVVKTARKQVIKKMFVVYLQEKNAAALKAFAFQENKKLSHIIDELVEAHITPQVKKELLNI